MLVALTNSMFFQKMLPFDLIPAMHIVDTLLCMKKLLKATALEKAK